MRWYLAGPICHVTDGTDVAWRDAAKERLDCIDPFDEEKINHLITAWYTEAARMGLMSGSEAGERAERLQAAVQRPDLRVLAPNPLLLTMMALLHSSWGRLPDDRVRLYGEIVELLLARWEQSRLGREASSR